jgi:hypothetical protein
MSESLEMQLAKYETLSRIRGTRVAELEDIVIKLNAALREREQQSNEATEELQDAMAFIDNLVAENKVLKKENETISDLRRKLDHEREISQCLDMLLHSRERKPIRSTVADFRETCMNNSDERIIKSHACTQTEFFSLMLSKYSQTDEMSKYVTCRE